MFDISKINTTGLIVAPGLVDIHVHFREPGFEYKEDILSGASAAAAGGFTTVYCMPNTKPVADNADTIILLTTPALRATPPRRGIYPDTTCHPSEGGIYQAEEPSPCVRVLPIGAVTIGQMGEELTDFAALKKAGAVALSDDGMPIKDDEIMRKALIAADKEDILIISHCEEEEPMVERDCRLAAETNTRIHIAHVSTAKAVETIRTAKKAGVKVTAETCPHYFSLTSDAVSIKGTNAKMSPPLRTQKDVEAIIEGLKDGTIDAIATDHAPHSVDEKNQPFDKAPNGIIGLETSLAVTLTYLYHTGKFSLDEIIKLMSENPVKLLGLDCGVLESVGGADIVIFDPNEEWVVDSSKFKSKSKNTPYDGMKLKGKVKYTVVGGKLVYQD